MNVSSNRFWFYFTDILDILEPPAVPTGTQSATRSSLQPSRIDDDEDSDSEPINKRPKMTTRIKWTTLEMKEVAKYFQNFLATKTTPGQKECERVRAISKQAGGEIHRRGPPLIIKKISNMNKK